jgi:hypothetical protein
VNLSVVDQVQQPLPQLLQLALEFRNLLILLSKLGSQLFQLVIDHRSLHRHEGLARREARERRLVAGHQHGVVGQRRRLGDPLGQGLLGR